MGFYFQRFFPAQSAQAGEAVGDAFFHNARQTRRLFIVHRSDDFAADVVPNLMLITKTEEGFVAFAAMEGFVAAGLVINAGVNDAAVAP